MKVKTKQFETEATKDEDIYLVKLPDNEVRRFRQDLFDLLFEEQPEQKISKEK